MKNLKGLLFAALIFAVSVVATSIPMLPFVESIGATLIGVIGLSIVASYVMPKNVAFMAIPTVQAAKLFTEKVVKVFRDDIAVPGFLRSFFKSTYAPTKFVSIAVRRGTELVAVDVKRYSDGNRNTFSLATQKTFLPPMYHEFLDVSDHQLYDAMITAIGTGQLTFFSEMTKQMASDFIELRKKIERAIELQCAQVLDTGVIALTNSTDIDFKRKATSILAYNAAYAFDDDAIDPSVIIKVGCKFLRETGKASGGTFNLILGDEALSAFLSNLLVQAKSDLKDYDLNQIYAPEMMPEGMTLHGIYSAGSYKVRLWGYPESYETVPGTSVDYVNSKKIVLLPLKPVFVLAYAAVPQLIENGNIPQKGEYLIQEEFKKIEGIHRMHIKSAPIAVPVAVDQIWTATVLN